MKERVRLYSAITKNDSILLLCILRYTPKYNATVYFLIIYLMYYMPVDFDELAYHRKLAVVFPHPWKLLYNVLLILRKRSYAFLTYLQDVYNSILCASSEYPLIYCEVFYVVSRELFILVFPVAS